MKTLVQPQQWKHNGLTYTGVSIAGVGTSICIPEWSICFDVAQGTPWAVPMRNIFISHGHMDHASGIPYIISQRSLYQLPPAKFYLPQVMIEPLEKIMELWAQIEMFSYDLQFVPVKSGERIDLEAGLFARVFPTKHRIPSQGYTIFSEKKKLMPKYQGQSGHQLEAFRKQGIAIEHTVSTPEVSFTGDTQIEFLDLAPEVKNSRILLMEMTYVDGSRPVERARQWGHLHLDEFLPRLKELNCEKIILLHLSRRHRHHEVKELLTEKLSLEDQQRTILW
jgi:ribonuclease Z